MTLTSQQYRPLSSLEVAADDGYSVRALRDGAANVNNAVYYACAQPYLAIPCIPPWYSHDSVTTERVIAQLCPWRVAQPYDSLAIGVGHQRSAGTGTVTWRVYVDKQRYTGGADLDTSGLSADYDVETFVCDSDSHDVPVPALATVRRSTSGYVFVLLTAQNEDASTRGLISAWSIWPAMY